MLMSLVLIFVIYSTPFEAKGMAKNNVQIVIHLISNGILYPHIRLKYIFFLFLKPFLNVQDNSPIAKVIHSDGHYPM